MTRLLTDTERDGIRALQARCGANAKEKGFWAEGEYFKRAVELKTANSVPAYRNYVANRLMLIKGELSEAHEELRKGYDPTFEYVTYPPEMVAEFGVDVVAAGFAAEGRLPKPEGFPSELADALIRIMDTAEELKIDLAAVVEGKMEYNATREKMHGKKF
jgi:NTP pyrophosphatase (non-canonical NTP hydrolase)